jgi:alkylation response protein AidB-like acyl-CoA dehydrogenase
MTDGPEAADEVALVRESARAFAAGASGPAAIRAGRFRLPWHEADRLPAMADLGWFGALIPAEHGGHGLGFAAMAALVEELGRGLIGGDLLALAVLAPRALLRGDNEVLTARLLPAVADGARLLALAWQEGSDALADPEATTTTATPEGDGWRLDGAKRFVAGAWAAQGFLVNARSPDGLRLFHLPRDAAGLRAEEEWRADGSPATRLTLDGVRAGAADVAAGPARAAAAVAAAIEETAILAAAELVGVTRAALATTLDYMRLRVAFGRPIASFQALQHRAADMHVQQELAAATLADAVRAAEGKPDAEVLRTAAARAKARCNEAALFVTRQAIQLHGGIGFTDACDAGLYLKRALVLSAWLGTTAAHHARLSPYAGSAPGAGPDPEAAEAGATLARLHATPVAERDWNAVPDAAFRAVAHLFLDRNLPRDLRFRAGRQGWKAIGDWYLFLSREGWLAPTWPAAWGGMGLSPAKLLIYYEEMERVGGPRLLDHGINNVGSILLERGTEEQRRTYLPKILSGEHIWCQGYSEPDAGSDLASLRTEAVLDGEEFVVTGQKIWTTLAQEATHIYALVRTDKSKPGRDGISFLLMDLRQPGVTVRPILNIAGHSEFCEVFLDGARTHRSNLVGALNDGWAVSRAVLGFERLRVGSPRNSTLALQRLVRAAAELGLDRDPLIRARLVALTCDVQDLASLYERAADALKAGIAPGPEASVLKILATETEQRLTQTLVEILGDVGTLAGPQLPGNRSVDALTPFLSTRAVSIYGGTNEIQRNIIAQRVLRLGRGG